MTTKWGPPCTYWKALRDANLPAVCINALQKYEEKLNYEKKNGILTYMKWREYVFTQDMLDELTAKAKASERRRANLDLWNSADDQSSECSMPWNQKWWHQYIGIKVLLRRVSVFAGTLRNTSMIQKDEEWKVEIYPEKGFGRIARMCLCRRGDLKRNNLNGETVEERNWT